MRTSENVAGCSPPSTSYSVPTARHSYRNRSRLRAVAAENDNVPMGLQLTRRSLLQASTLAAINLGCGTTSHAMDTKCMEQYKSYLTHPDWSGPGPLQVVHLPKLEHTCVSCFPSCVGTSCLIRVDITYPKGGRALGLGPPYPLAIFSSGFLVSSESYKSYAETLASWGYTVMLYDRQETVADFLNDDACVNVIQDLMNWCSHNPLLRRIADTERVFLAGHSRGGKLAALAAARDPRVAAVCLIDAVDNTQYAPLAPGFPSAVAALRDAQQAGRFLPVAVVGGGRGGDCAPQESNYSRFYAANKGPTWEVDIGDAGHFSFLDQQSPLQRAVCPEGGVSEDAVRRVSQAVMVAWAETMMRHKGVDYLAQGLPVYPGACQQHGDEPLLLQPASQVLPTWSWPLPLFYEDGLVLRKPEAMAPADLRTRVRDSALAADNSAPGESKELGMLGMNSAGSRVKQRIQSRGFGGSSLTDGFNGMLRQLRVDMNLADISTRYKNI